MLEFDFKVFLTTQELVNTYDGPKPQQDFFGYMIYSTNEEPTPTTAPTTTATTAPTTTATTAPTTTATTAPTTTATTAPTATPAPTAADPGSSGGEGTGGNLRPTATPEPTAEPTVPGPTPTATKAPELPATGDEANLVLWFAMLAVAAVGMTVMVMHPAKKFR